MYTILFRKITELGRQLRVNQEPPTIRPTTSPERPDGIRDNTEHVDSMDDLSSSSMFHPERTVDRFTTLDDASRMRCALVAQFAQFTVYLFVKANPMISSWLSAHGLQLMNELYHATGGLSGLALAFFSKLPNQKSSRFDANSAEVHAAASKYTGYISYCFRFHELNSRS